MQRKTLYMLNGEVVESESGDGVPLASLSQFFAEVLADEPEPPRQKKKPRRD